MNKVLKGFDLYKETRQSYLNIVWELLSRAKVVLRLKWYKPEFIKFQKQQTSTEMMKQIRKQMVNFTIFKRHN